jgi:hypothetical protein
MGVHYVNHIDGSVSVTQPEAMVSRARSVM